MNLQKMEKYVSYNIIKMNYVIMNDVISILHLVDYRTSFL